MLINQILESLCWMRPAGMVCSSIPAELDRPVQPAGQMPNDRPGMATVLSERIPALTRVTVYW